jgi:hypothetical protein
MELTILDKVNANPTAADIVTALSAASFPEDWSITLDENTEGGATIDALYEPDGTFRVLLIENHRRRYAVPKIDAATLSALLQKFLVHDRTWLDLCKWESPEETKARVKAEGLAATKGALAAAAAAPRPPLTPGSALASAASIAILGFAGYCIFKLSTQGLAFITDRFPNAEAKLAVFSGGFGLVALLIFIASYRYSRAARSWPVVFGTVTVSKVESHPGDATDRNASRLHRPVIEFSYSVNGQNYRSRQRQLGVDTSGSESWAKTVAERYPIGAAVEVRYDPANPATAALENPTGTAWIILGVSVFCIAVCVHVLHVSGS